MIDQPARASSPAQVEAQRLDAVHRYAIVDAPPDGAFDRVCALAARLLTCR